MSSPSHDIDNNNGNRAERPNVIPDSPLQPQPQIVWYPSPNQQHYTIVMGVNPQQRQQQQRYVITEQNGRGQPSSTICDAPAPLAISPPAPKEDEWGEEDSTALPVQFTRRSPLNAHHIFRPRQRSRRNSTRDSSRAETRQESFVQQEPNGNHGEEQRQAESSAWEPIPWCSILAAAGNTMGESESSLQDTTCPTVAGAPAAAFAFGTNPRGVVPSLSYDPSILLPHLEDGRDEMRVSRTKTTTRQAQSLVSNCNNTSNHDASTTMPALAFQCPTSPLTRRQRPLQRTCNTQPDFSYMANTPESETARRLAASEFTASACMKRKVPDSTDSHQPAHKYPRLLASFSGVQQDGDNETAPAPPSTWPKDSPLLEQFWTYCAQCRPHLLPTLMSTVKECQSQKSKKADEEEDSPLVDAVTTELVRVWGGPLLGEVYRQVLAHKQQQDQDQERKRAVANATALRKSQRIANDQKDSEDSGEEYGNLLRASSIKQAEPRYSAKSREDDTQTCTNGTTTVSSAASPISLEMAIAYGFHLAQRHRDNKDLTPDFWQHAAQKLLSMSQGDRQLVWQGIPDNQQAPLPSASM